MSSRQQRRGAGLRTLRNIADIPVGVALLFAFTLAAPRAPLVYHTHPGGGHAHVHLLDGAARATPQAIDRRPAFARDQGDASGHVHFQQRYQTAAVAALPFVLLAVALAAVRLASPQFALADRVAAASARAPPRLLAV